MLIYISSEFSDYCKLMSYYEIVSFALIIFLVLLFFPKIILEKFIINSNVFL
jgi:hypothetical protein